jgi:DNA-binding response OmpR family regulator
MFPRAACGGAGRADPRGSGVSDVRILILEDDPFIALDLQCIVEGEGHTASVCGAVAEARRLAGDLDFALLDVDVADGKSYGLALALAERGVPFAFVSGSRPRELPPALRDARFIPKPFAEATIVAALPGARPARRPVPLSAAERPAA